MKKCRKKISLGREARQILFKMPPDLFFALHQRAHHEEKSVNFIVNELARQGLEMKNPMPADGYR